MRKRLEVPARTLGLLVMLISWQPFGCTRDGGPQTSMERPDPGPSMPKGETYGEPLDTEQPLVPLRRLLEDPDRYAGQVVTTQGEVAQVCQKMGCWMELRSEDVDTETAAELRVPMAGHAFFVPKDARGRRATVQGTLQVQPLDDAQKAHLEAEGARLTSALSLVATGVRLEN